MKNILKKNFVFVAAAVLIVSAYFIIGVLVYANKQYNAINMENMEEAVNIIKRFTPPEVFTDNDAAAQWISLLDISGEYRITLISRNGRVIFDTEADSANIENHLDRPEFQAAVKDGAGNAIRRSATLGKYYIYSAAAINDSDGKFAGVLRFSGLIPGFFTRLLSATLPFLAFGFLIILGICVSLYHFTRYQSNLVQIKLNAELEEKTAELKILFDKAEAESRHREVILNSLFDGVLTLDNKLNIIHANQRLRSLFDPNREYRNVSLIQFSNSAELEAAANIVLSTGQPYEFTLKRYNGKIQQFQGFAAPFDTGSLTPPGVIMVLGDISRLVRLEQIRKDFAANVSHELRTPIQVIQGFAENILNAQPDEYEQILHFAKIIRKNARAMDNLTSDLLTLVSLENPDAERPPLEEAAVDNIINEAVGMVAVTAKEKNISISVSCPPELKVKAYSSLLVQAIVNLLDNSIKYSGKDSPITVLAFNQGELIIEVKDKGIGIPAEHIDRIFERFYRADRSRSREAGGTGLGLSIVRHIALLHRGKVEAESHTGEGSTFRLKLPLA
jgi:two-component system, OmpR family, phosphate regulon sensor histidine kinase PhoR